MPDYSLGRAHGQIQIDYDGSGADKAARDLDKVAVSSEAADKSLGKTQKTLGDTDRQLASSGSSAEGYSQRLRDVRQASDDAEAAERHLKTTLLDSKATVDDIDGAYKRLEETRKRHTKAVDAERDAHKALSEGMTVSGGAVSALIGLIPSLSTQVEKLTTAQDTATESTNGLSQALGLAAKAAMALGQPEIAAGLYGVSEGIDTVSSAASGLGTAVKQIAGFELAFGKLAGMTLGATSLGALGGLGGAAGAQGMVEMAGAAEQLSGMLGLLPAAISGVEFASQTLQVAFHGVDSALKDMMSDDPKKFLEDIKNMGPIAAQAMLQVAGFRDQIKLAGAGIQDSFFSKIIADIKPLIQTWLPAIAGGMAQVSGIFGEAADQFAKLLMQPAAMAAFQQFVGNISAGLKAMEPAMAPLLEIFTQLTVVGSSFFAQIGAEVSHMLDFFAQIVDKAAASGQLQAWIQDGINAFGHLVNIVYSVGSAFLNIMDIADKFGGGGLLGWLEQLTDQFNKWTQSADGQKTLTDFFSTLRTATDAFTPMLKPLVEGLAAIGQSFVQLGIATAPGWQTVFDTFATVMQQLGPQIAATAPALNQFLGDLASAFSQLMADVGPDLPAIFMDLSNAFVALLPQIQPLVDIFLELAQNVGPQLPKFFGAVTSLIEALIPYVPVLVGFVRDFVSVLTWFISTGATVIGWFTSFFGWVRKFVSDVPGAFGEVKNAIVNFFGNLAKDAEDWGKNLIRGLVNGIKAGIGWVGDAAKSVVDEISSWFPQSPAKKGPFSGDGYTYVRGQKIVADMAAGMASAQPAIEAAAASTASAASGGLAGAGAAGGGGAPSPGGAGTTGSALLPDNIANADTSILTAYLRHQFSDTDGLKGLAKDLGKFLDVAKSGFDLINSHVVQPLFQGLGMLPGAKDQSWRKLTPSELVAQQQSDLQKDALKGAGKGPTWGDVFGQGSPAAAPVGGGVATPLGLTASSSKSDIQKAIIAAGRARGMNDGAIQTALAVADAESGFNPTISGGVQGSAGLVSGLFQQSPTSGWGTLDQVNDPNHAINAFYDAYAKQLANNPTNPQLAAVLTQNPQLGSGAQGSAYWNAVSAKLGDANSIMGAYGKGVTGPTWAQITGAPAATAPSGVKIGKDGSISVPTGTPLPGVVSPTGLPDAHGAHVQIAEVEAIAQRFGLQLTAGKNDHSVDGGFHPKGMAGDFSNGQGNTPEMLAFADYMAQNFGPLIQELIYSDPKFSQLLGGGKNVTGTGYYSPGTLAEHTNHVHVAITDEQAAAFQQALGTGTLPTGPTPLSAQTPVVGTGLGTSSGLILPSGQSLDALTNNTAKTATTNDKLLQAYLQGNPALAAQIDAAKTPGATDQTVMDGLTGISKTIDTLKQQDAVGNKNTIDALQSTQSQLAQQQGFTQGPGALQQAQSIAGGVSSAIGAVFQAVQGGLDALTATQDIADRLVYGIRNTEDINKLIDDFQKYIVYAADIFSAAGSITSMIGSFTGGMDMGGTSAAGSMLSLIAGVLQGVNAAIDFGQQVYEITMGYVGRFMSVLTGLGGTDLMGNVGFLLNKNTGQLLSYSMDNPQQQDVSKVPSWMNSWYDYNGKGNPNPQVNQQLNIYAGPGQSPGEMMNETMWMVNTGGTTGAMQPANF
jgi:hypothetical protein